METPDLITRAVNETHLLLLLAGTLVSSAVMICTALVRIAFHRRRSAPAGNGRGGMSAAEKLLAG